MSLSEYKGRASSVVLSAVIALLVSGCSYDLPSFRKDTPTPDIVEPVAAPASQEADPVNTGSVPATASPGNLTVVQVKPGDSLMSIAERHGVSWIDLADANELPAPYRISEGQTLILPAKR